MVVYTSDNGFFLGDHGFYNKMWMYEQSLHIPFIVRYPKEIGPGLVNNDIVTNLDFAPTFLDYAGVARQPDIQGRSFRALLTTITALTALGPTMVYELDVTNLFISTQEENGNYSTSKKTLMR